MKLPLRILKKNLIPLIVFGLIFSTCVYYFSTKFFEQSSYDAISKITSSKIASEDIVTVVIDNNSIREIGAWPWKRTRYSEIFDFLKKYGNVKVIAFDAVLTAQNEATSDKEFIKRLKDTNDTVVAGVDFSQNLNTKNKKEDLDYFAQNFAINVDDFRTIKKSDEANYTSFQEFMPDYLQNLKMAGSVNAALDNDGILRGFEPFVYMDGHYYPSLALAAFYKVQPFEKIEIFNTHYNIVFEDGKFIKIPLKYQNGKLIQQIEWYAPFDTRSRASHKKIQASDVIKSYYNMEKGSPPTFDLKDIQNKIVVVGATANALYDLKLTPVAINYPGVDIQATAIDNFYQKQFMQQSGLLINLGIIIVTVATTLVLIYFLSPMFSIMGILFLLFLYFYLVLFSYSNSIAINVITTYIFILLATIFGYLNKFVMEDYKKEKLRRAMNKYMNTNVVDNIIKSSDEVKLGGKKTEMTILIADIRGFTRISEDLEPEKVTELLNEYFSIMLPIIERYKGVVNKFIGDAILAVFNEPIKDTNHPKNAILCAMDMLQATNNLKKKWKNENKPSIGISIGINTGNAFIGNVGTQNHLEYTVIGDTVNVASRIEAQNRQFNTQILISESTYEKAKDILDVIKISSVEIRGREKTIDIYEIIKLLDSNENN